MPSASRGLTVDTHFARLAQRFGWTAHTDPAKIGRDVAVPLPRQDWIAASRRLTWHGHRVRHAQRTPGGRLRYSRRQLAFAARIRELLDQGHTLAAALGILDLEDDLAAERALTAPPARTVRRAGRRDS